MADTKAMASKTNPRESMKDLAEQKEAELKSELNEVRHEISQTQEWGFDQIEFTMSMWSPLKFYICFIAILFLVLGAWEEITIKNTFLNKWIRAKMGHHDLH